jgi:hypothetical protein
MILTVVTGQIDLPKQAQEQWRSLRLSTATYDDWTDDAPLFTGESPRTHATVGDVLEAAARLGGRPDFFECDGQTIRGLLMPEATTALHQDLATALRLLETVGGRGRVAFVVPQENVAFLIGIGEKLDLGGGPCGCHEGGCGCHENDDGCACGCGAKGDRKDEDACGCGAKGDREDDDACGCCAKGDAEDEEDEECGCGDEPAFVTWADAHALFGADEVASFGFVRIMDFFNAWSTDNSLTRATYLTRAAGLGLVPLEEQPHHRELLERVRSLDPSALHAAMLKAEVKDGEQLSLGRRYATPEALTAALAEPQPVARAAAIELLSLLHPEQVEGRVDGLLNDRSTEVRRHAVMALGKVPTNSALTRLLALDPTDHRGDVMYTTAITQMVAATQAPEADALVRAMLDSTSLSAASFANAQRGSKNWELLATRGGHAIALGATRPGPTTVQRLFELLENHPAEEIRVAAAKALAHTGGREVQAKSELVTCTLLHMGKALNGDDARRRELLGLSREKYDSGLIRFHGVTHAALSKLIEERFADPEATQNDAPSIGTFLELLEEHPELRVGGYVTAPTRNDYRVSVDSISCPRLKDVPTERREAIEELFETLAQSATNTDENGAELSCQWT